MQSSNALPLRFPVSVWPRCFQGPRLGTVAYGVWWLPYNPRGFWWEIGCFRFLLGRNKRSLPEGGGETPLKSESPLSSPAASVLRRVVAPLTREREGLGPRGPSAACQRHNRSQFGQPALPTLLADNSRRRPPRMNRPIHGGGWSSAPGWQGWVRRDVRLAATARGYAPAGSGQR